MANLKSLQKAAKELNKVLGLEPALNVEAKESALTKSITECLEEEGLITEEDEFTKATQAVLDELGDEDEDEDDDPPKKKGKSKKKAAPVEDDDDDDDDDDPPKKKGKGKPASFTSTKETLGTTRMIEVAKAMNKIKKSKSIDAVAEVADASFVKAGGTSNLKQAKNIIKVLLPAAEEWEIVTNKNGKLSN